MKFCSHCADPLVEEVPPGDDRPRKVCPGCGAVHYRNPLAVVGCLVEREDELLLCRRAIEPARGRWTVPAGFLELGEAAREGARRETREEALAEVEVGMPHALFDLPHIGQTYSLFRARLTAPGFGVGEESLEVAFVRAAEIPWDELAFPVMHFALRLWVEDRAESRARLHLGALRWMGVGSRFDAANYALDDHLRMPVAD